MEKAEPSDREIADGDNIDLFRIRLHFNRRGLGRLRALVDRLNAAAPAHAPSVPLPESP